MDVLNQLTVLVKAGLWKPWVFVSIFCGQDHQYQNLVVSGEGWWRCSYIVQNSGFGLFYLIFSEVCATF